MLRCMVSNHYWIVVTSNLLFFQGVVVGALLNTMPLSDRMGLGNVSFQDLLNEKKRLKLMLYHKMLVVGPLFHMCLEAHWQVGIFFLSLFKNSTNDYLKLDYMYGHHLYHTQVWRRILYLEKYGQALRGRHQQKSLRCLGYLIHHLETWWCLRPSWLLCSSRSFLLVCCRFNTRFLKF